MSSRQRSTSGCYVFFLSFFTVGMLALLAVVVIRSLQRVGDPIPTLAVTLPQPATQAIVPSQPPLASSPTEMLLSLIPTASPASTAVPGVVQIDLLSDTSIYAQVQAGANNTDTANALRLANEIAGNLRVRLDDGTNVTIYQYRDGQWQESMTSASLATRTPIPAVVYTITTADGRECSQLTCEVLTYIPVGLELNVVAVEQGDALNGNTLWYITIHTGREIHVNSLQVTTIRPRPTAPRPTFRPPASSSGNRSGSSFSCPSNCTEARSRGMSAGAAAACGLDGDGDGVACYGD